MIEIMNEICQKYDNEYQMKLKVMENIAHARTEDELTIHCAMWEFQRHITPEFDLIFNELRLEADVDADTKTQLQFKQ